MVKPGSKKGPLVEAAADGSLTVFLKERAVDGAATQIIMMLTSMSYMPGIGIALAGSVASAQPASAATTNSRIEAR